MLHLLVMFGATPSLAAPEAPRHGEPAARGGAHEGAGEGAGEGSGGESHEGGGAGHHAYYTDDADHDGVPNWRDPKNGTEDNPEYVIGKLGWHTFNFVLLLGMLGYAARRPLVDTFRERALSIRHELTDSARSRDEAHQRHQEVLARLDRIEHEVTALETEAEADAKREEQKLVERAERESARIAEQAERNIRDEATRARQALRREAVELAVRLAEATLRKGVSADDQQALAKQFLASVGKGGDRV